MRHRWVVAAVASMVVTACGQPPAVPPPSTTSLAGAFTDVNVLADEAEATFFYKTRTTLVDCAAQRAEMPLVWHEHVRGRLADARWTRVTLFPEEPSRRSASFTFQLGDSGAWRADAPCLVTIAP